MSSKPINLTDKNVSQFVEWLVTKLAISTYPDNTNYILSSREDWAWQNDPSGKTETGEFWCRDPKDPENGSYGYYEMTRVCQVHVQLPTEWNLTYAGHYGTTIRISTEVGEALAKLWKTAPRYRNSKDLKFVGYRTLSGILRLLAGSDIMNTVAEAKAEAERKVYINRQTSTAKNLIASIDSLIASVEKASANGLTPASDMLGMGLADYKMQLEQVIKMNSQEETIA